MGTKLNESIRAMQARDRRCLLSRMRRRGSIALCRGYFRDIWAQIEAAVHEKMTHPVGEQGSID